MDGIEFLTEQLDNEIKLVSAKIFDCQKEELELREIHQSLVAKRQYILLNQETYARNMKTRFTKKELLSKYKIGNSTFSDVCKIGGLKPVDKLGRALVYDLSEFEQAMEDFKLWKSN